MPKPETHAEGDGIGREHRDIEEIIKDIFEKRFSSYTFDPDSAQLPDLSAHGNRVIFSNEGLIRLLTRLEYLKKIYNLAVRR